jgi:protein-tyrosine-phosphatase
MNILFICKHNRFRSKIAEALFKQLNRNKKIKVTSAGLMKGTPISNRIKNITKKNKINITGSPKYISDEVLRKQDIIINVAYNVPGSIFREYKNAKTINWKIRDVHENLSLKDYNLHTNRVINRIEKKVKRLTRKLEKV